MAVHARLVAVSGVDDLADLMTPEATAEIRRLYSLVSSYDVLSQHTLAWALYYRSLFPLASAATERELAVALFVRCLLAGVEASDIPDDLMDEVVNEAGRHSTPPLREASRTKDSSSVEDALRLWRRIAAACRETHPHRPVILNNLAVLLQLRGKLNDSAEDDREVVGLLEQAMEATPGDAKDQPLRLFNLGVSRRRMFDHTRDEEDLDEAIKYFQRSLEISPEDDPGRQETYAALSEAYRVGASRMRIDVLSTGEKLRTQLSEAVYAVCQLITVRDLEEKKRTIERLPQLRSRAALSVLDDFIENAAALGTDSPLPVPFLRAHRKVLAGLQESPTAEETSTAEPPEFVPPGPVPPQVVEAQSLLADGRVEEADVLLARTAERGRSDDDPHTEGHAELALHDLVFGSLHPAPGSVDRLAGHAAAAQEAFHRAGNRDGLTSALRRRLAIAVHFQDAPMVTDLMPRLIVLDPFGGVWWHAYLRAIDSDDLGYRRAQLEWCVDHAWRLGPDAAHYRAVCERKLAFLDGHVATEELTLPADLAALVEGVERNGPTGNDGERLAAALERVEAMRSHAQSVTVQRSLSAVYTRAYQALSLCTAKAVGPGAVEASVDVLERNSSRSLLLQMDGGASVNDAPSDSPHLDEQVSAYIREPTPHHLKLLTLTFDARRDQERRAQRGIMRRVAGPSRGPAPIRVEGLRALLGDDAVLFFGATGRAVLITSDDCAVVGEFEPDALDREAGVLHRRLSEGAPPAALGGLPVLDELTPQVRERVTEGSRLFVVPSGRLWLVPLGILGEPRLSDVYEVATVPSLSVLARLLRSGPAPEPSGGALMVGLADSDGSLRHARDEVDAAAAHYPRSRVWTGGDATVDTYRTAAPGANVIHLACHGFYLPDHPDFSGLRLAAARGGPGMLWYFDIGRTRLAASLVVLGACHAGTGGVLSGSEYTGIPGALLAAGARSVLAPLWAVDDRVTACLLESFHASYAATGCPASALREAQRACGGDAIDTVGSVHAFQLFGLS
ncbi:CHAT domain-containing protein [Actinomadura spongiicola]|uniref:CHAT domain-containing protein n=1 Tax=Actinomadura spongiicola TaxID=2303421 RepID=UPI001313FEDB|nr:CHAT domain-containing protein [Actinomadura spongiicola]